jgi:hypothetical protein
LFNLGDGPENAIHQVTQKASSGRENRSTGDSREQN